MRDEPRVLLLEDNAERVQRFTATLRLLDPALPLLIWRNAWVMIQEVEQHLSYAVLLSLDHDLEPLEDDPADPGDGMDVVRFLVAQEVIRPVIIHSSNTQRSTWMAGEFELAGWPCEQVAPLGEDWIEVSWRRRVRRWLRRRT